MRYLAPLLMLMLLGAVALSMPASAQPLPPPPRAGVQPGVRPLNDILNGVRRERPGSLADVQGPSAGPTGEPRYRLKWLTPDGRVLWLDTDARTGRVLRVEGADRGPGPNRGFIAPNGRPLRAGSGPGRGPFGPGVRGPFAPGRGPGPFLGRGGGGRGPGPGPGPQGNFGGRFRGGR